MPEWSCPSRGSRIARPDRTPSKAESYSWGRARRRTGDAGRTGRRRCRGERRDHLAHLPAHLEEGKMGRAIQAGAAMNEATSISARRDRRRPMSSIEIQVAAMAPSQSWPSMPMFQKRTRAATRGREPDGDQRAPPRFRAVSWRGASEVETGTSRRGIRRRWRRGGETPTAMRRRAAAASRTRDRRHRRRSKARPELPGGGRGARTQAWPIISARADRRSPPRRAFLRRSGHGSSRRRGATWRALLRDPR